MKHVAAVLLILFTASSVGLADGLLFENSDFKDGSLKNWTAQGAAFDPHQPTKDDGKEGKLDDTRGVEPKGSLISAEFEITSPYIGFMIAADNDFTRCYVQLLVDDREIRRTAGAGCRELGFRIWNVKGWVGKKAQIKIVDNAADGTGFISADNFRFYDCIYNWHMTDHMPPVGKSIPVAIRDYPLHRFIVPAANGTAEVSAIEVGPAKNFPHLAFDMINLGDNKLAFKSHKNGKYMTADPAGVKPLMVTATEIGPNETFDLHYDVHELYIGRNIPALKSMANGKFLASRPLSQEKALIYNSETKGSWNASFDITYLDFETYKEKYRGGLHYSPKYGWLNDVNGLFYDETTWTWHLFHQYCPREVKWAGIDSHWAHAISNDMVHWQELAPALVPEKHIDPARDEVGCWSGSAVVDFNNSAQLQTGDKKAAMLFYSSDSGKEIVQNMAYSTDGGITFKRYDKNPVLGNLTPGNRDPKVFWYAEGSKWIMALWVQRGAMPCYEFYDSQNLKDWTFQSRIEDFYECPDIFKLLLDDDPKQPKWVIVNGSGVYLVGQFDGKSFTKEVDKQNPVCGGTYYATQTWAIEHQKTETRRIQTAWMVGDFPIFANMPWNQQIAFPVELKLRTYPEGIKIARQPIEERKILRNNGVSNVLISKTTLKPGQNPLDRVDCELMEIEMVFKAPVKGKVGFRIRGEHNSVIYNATSRTVHVYIAFDRNTGLLQKQIAQSPQFEIIDGKVKLQILVDRNCLDVYVDDGRFSMPCYFWPISDDHSIELFCQDTDVEIESLNAWPLKSMWEK